MADEPYRPLNQPLNHKGSNNTASAGGASLLASIFNLSNTTLGAGIVSIPFFFSQCGVVLGAAILILVGGLSALASFLLVASAELSGEWSYISVASAAYGRTGRTTVMAAILLLTLGVLSAFFVTLGETGSETLESFLPARLSGVWWARPLFVKAAFAAAPLLPLALQRNLSALAAASTLVVVAIMYLVGVVIIMGSGDCPTTDDDGGGDDDDCADDESGGGVSAVRFGPDFFSAVPIAVLAFGNQVNVHQVVRELNEPTPARRAQVILCTNGLVTAVYAAIGVAGYARFGNDGTMDNILSNYHGLSGDELVAFSVARVAIVCAVLCSYPMLLFPCRACLHDILSSGGSSGSGSEGSVGLEFEPLACLRIIARWTGFCSYSGEGGAAAAVRVSEAQCFVAETVAIMAVTFLVAWVVPTLSIIMGFTGAVMGTFLGFIFPALYYRKLLPTSSQQHGEYDYDYDTGFARGHPPQQPTNPVRTGSTMRLAATALLWLGVACGVVCVSAQIYGMAVV